LLTLAAAKSWAAVQRNVHLYIALPMHSLKLCTVGRWVRVDSRATEAWQARVIPFHSFWVFEAASKPRPYRGSVQYHAPRLVTLSSAAPSNSPHSGIAALTVAQMSRNYVEVWFQHFPQQAKQVVNLTDKKYTNPSIWSENSRLCIDFDLNYFRNDRTEWADFL
jgi:hypothetical protein